MQLQTFDLFTINADTYYNSLESKIDNDVATTTEATLTDPELEQRTADIFNKHYIFNEFEIIDTDKGIITEHLDDATAANLIGNGFTPTAPTNAITEIWYDLEVKSGLLSVYQTVNFPPTTVKGVIKGSLIRLQFYFQSDDTTLIGPLALQEKDRFTDLVKANNAALKMYFDSKKIFFLAQIKAKIQDILAQNLKKKEERANF
ncbi:MAG: hypothetical protein EOO88_01705 [Pedobacter sp.]|nr:MAG: hypothetical protein EOO88_01705 [Pedobacter sp.]